MSSYVNPAARIPQASYSGGHAPALTSRAPQSEAEQAPPAPHPDPIAISRIVLNAESLIASAMGVRSHEVAVCVRSGRYQF